MTKRIRRYDLVETGPGYESWREMRLGPTGEYIRYADVAGLVEVAEKYARFIPVEGSPDRHSAHRALWHAVRTLAPFTTDDNTATAGSSV